MIYYYIVIDRNKGIHEEYYDEVIFIQSKLDIYSK